MIRQPQRPAQRGFTLLELILATALMATIGAVLYSSLSVAYKARTAAARQVDSVREASIVMGILRHDFESVLPPRGTLNGPFVGTNGGTPGAGLDTLEFYTVGRDFAATADDPFAEGVRRVNLRLRTDLTPPALVRQVETNLLAPVEQGPAEEVLATDVRGLELRYFDGTSWTDTWDSTAEGDVLPYAVEVTLTFLKPARRGAGGGDDTYRVQQVIPLSCAQEPTEPADAS